MFHSRKYLPRAASRQTVLASVIALTGLLVGSDGSGQVPRPVSHGPLSNSVAVGLLLRQMDGVKRVLLIGAHPDDEDTALLAALARGRGAEAAYLALSRGEGGQNLIGPELGEGLGLLRTGELLAARSLDGARQYFTRAYDFGYSKSAAETFRHWPRDSLLRDVVWVVRTFRPQIIVSMFSGTARDGHGQHQVAGLLARQAFDLAGDPDRFPELAARGATPWQPLKLYRRTWRDPENSTLTFPTGNFDPLLGRSHHQIAMASRSEHRSQDFGTAQDPGPQRTHLRLLESRVPGPDTSLFAGIDTTLSGLAATLTGPIREEVVSGTDRYRAQLERARDRLNALTPALAAPSLAEALLTLRELRARVGGVRAEQAPVASPGASGTHSGPARGAGASSRTGSDERGRTISSLVRALDDRIQLAERALLANGSVIFVPRAGDDVIVAGQPVGVEVALWNGGPYRLGVEQVTLLWDATPVSSAAVESHETLAPSSLRSWSLGFEIPADARVSEPYFLREPRTGDLYRWPDRSDAWALPTASPSLWVHAALRLRVDTLSVRLELRRPVRYREVDKASGEFWRPVQVVPALSVQLTPALVAWPMADTVPREISLSLRDETSEGIEGSVRLEMPDGWRSVPGERSFKLDGSGAQAALTFTVLPAKAEDAPAAAWSGGRAEAVEIRAVATEAGGRTFDERLSTVDYPHIEPTLLLEPAVTRIHRFPVEVGRRRVGYVMGSGDAGPEAIRQLGVAVEVLEPRRLDRELFERFDVLVLGIRAYEVLPELAAANDALLDWVREGGVLIVQYNKYEFSDGGFAPFPIEMRRPADRVTDEASPVRLLEPDSPALSSPNRITADDFEGWVQERGLYFPSSWAERYTPLLETGDPGEEPSRGSLLVGTVEQGLYIYTSLSFFRQLPAGVPGAYRLLANLLSLEPAAWRAYLGRRPSDEGSSP